MIINVVASHPFGVNVIEPDCWKLLISWLHRWESWTEKVLHHKRLYRNPKFQTSILPTAASVSGHRREKHPGLMVSPSQGKHTDMHTVTPKDNLLSLISKLPRRRKTVIFYTIYNEVKGHHLPQWGKKKQTNKQVNRIINKHTREYIIPQYKTTCTNSPLRLVRPVPQVFLLASHLLFHLGRLQTLWQRLQAKALFSYVMH